MLIISPYLFIHGLSDVLMEEIGEAQSITRMTLFFFTSPLLVVSKLTSSSLRKIDTYPQLINANSELT